ncbi:MAG TPA: DUF418 domain-containing protein [Chondromyces sp.]|nr:DUF418 domain-containing protein [Chondromyces sp.]
MQIQPIEKRERIVQLDILRGAALLGIFLVNMISFHSPYLYYNPYEWWDAAKDYQNFQWIDVFVQASFYPLFAMMFGYGAAMQRERAIEKGLTYWRIGIRRFSFLLLIGMLHAFLIWSGDILINYAVFGLVLLLFLPLSGRMLLILGSILLFLPNLFLSIMMLLMAQADPTSVSVWTDISGITNSISAYGSGTFQEITVQRFHDWYAVNGPENVFYLFISIFPLLLIGAGAQKVRLFRLWALKPKMAMQVAVAFVLTGVIIKSFPILFEPNLAYLFVQDSIGGPLLAIGYAAFISWAAGFSKIGKTLYPLASAGRMSLTNYLLQSIIGTLIFYHYGMGLYGQITLTTGIWLVFAIFALQVILSELWLKRFNRGPVEYIWRLATYGRQKNKTERGS